VGVGTVARPSFVHLHNHSQYSLLDGASQLEDILDTAVKFGMPAVAVTDHGNLFGAVRFHDLAKAAGSSRSSVARPISPRPIAATARRRPRGRKGARRSPTTI